MSDSLMFCAACGSSLKPGNLFCSKCGASTGRPAAPEAPQDAQRVVEDDAASPREALRAAWKLYFSDFKLISVLFLIFAVGGAGALAWQLFRAGPPPAAGSPPGIHVISLTPENTVDVAVVQLMSWGPYDEHDSDRILVGRVDNGSRYGTTVYSLLQFPTAPQDATRVILKLYTNVPARDYDLMLTGLDGPWAGSVGGSFAWDALPDTGQIGSMGEVEGFNTPRPTGTPIGSGQWVEFDITALNREWASGRTTNNGVRLELSSGDGYELLSGDHVEFVSVNSDQADLRPQIVWEVGTNLSESRAIAPASPTLPVAAASPSLPFTAVVSESAGTFTFPYPSSTGFEWCSGGQQYGFEVNARTRTDEHEFGFSLFGPMGATSCERGNLQDLFRAGQTGAFRIQGGSGSMVPNSDSSISIRADREQRLIVVSATGTEIVRRLFESRPEAVSFRTTTPQGKQERTVRVQYD